MAGHLSADNIAQPGGDARFFEGKGMGLRKRHSSLLLINPRCDKMSQARESGLAFLCSVPFWQQF